MADEGNNEGNSNDKIGGGVGGGESDHINAGSRDDVVVKIGLVGDAQVGRRQRSQTQSSITIFMLIHAVFFTYKQVGKTTLMVKYVENKFDEDYIQTLGERVVFSILLFFCSDAPLFCRMLHSSSALTLLF